MEKEFPTTKRLLDRDEIRKRTVLATLVALLLVGALVFAGQLTLDRITGHIADLARTQRTVIAERARTRAAAPGDPSAVRRHALGEREDRIGIEIDRELARLPQIQHAVAALVLGVVVAEALFLLGPLFRRTSRAIEAITRSEENARRRSLELRLDTLFQESPLGVALIAADGKILQANARLATMLQSDGARLVGRDLAEVIELGEGIHPALDVHKRLSIEIPYRGSGQEARWGALTLSPLGEGGESLALAILHDVTDRKRLETRLRRDATIDSLTSLGNRRGLREHLAHMLDNTSGGAVAMIDLDNFKYVNDRYGHAVGDDVLREVARRLRLAVGSRDYVGRLGGDEFVVALADIPDRSGVERPTAQLLQTLAEPYDVEGQRVRLGASIGVALVDARYTRPDDVLRDADAAAYQAKSTGRGRYVVFDARRSPESARRSTLVADLPLAIDRKQLTLVYQPIVDVATGECTAFEALARWRHPVLGDVRPAEFVPLAEETGLIIPLGRQLLETALATAGEWLRNPEHVGVRLHVNVSALQLVQPDFTALVAEALAKFEVPSSSLLLEITESALVAEREEAFETIATLRRRGIAMCIDDFGTGYSSLGYLNTYPIDSLKIDRSFVSANHSSLASPAIVRTIVALANDLGVDVVAEGVETERQARELYELGCSQIQGFVISPPVPFADFARARFKRRTFVA